MTIIGWMAFALAWAAAGTYTAVTVYRRDPETWLETPGKIGDYEGWILLLIGVVWPISTAILLAYIAATTSPSQTLHRRREAKQARINDRELAEEQHRTAIAEERVRQAQALEEERRILGLQDPLSQLPE